MLTEKKGGEKDGLPIRDYDALGSELGSEDGVPVKKEREDSLMPDNAFLAKGKKNQR